MSAKFTRRPELCRKCGRVTQHLCRQDSVQVELVADGLVLVIKESCLCLVCESRVTMVTRKIKKGES